MDQDDTDAPENPIEAGADGVAAHVRGGTKKRQAAERPLDDVPVAILVAQHEAVGGDIPYAQHECREEGGRQEREAGGA